jgi:hypothetical protein
MDQAAKVRLCPPKQGDSVAEVMQQIVAANDTVCQICAMAVRARAPTCWRRRRRRDRSRAGEDGNFSSCNFPQLIKYYTYLEREPGPDADERSAQPAEQPAAACSGMTRAARYAAPDVADLLQDIASLPTGCPAWRLD